MQWKVRQTEIDTGIITHLSKNRIFVCVSVYASVYLCVSKELAKPIYFSFTAKLLMCFSLSLSFKAKT